MQEKLAKPIRGQDAAELRRNKAAMLRGFPSTVPSETMSALERMAEVISEQRLAYAARKAALEGIKLDAERRNRDIEASRRVMAAQQQDWRRPIPSFLPSAEI